MWLVAFQSITYSIRPVRVTGHIHSLKWSRPENARQLRERSGVRDSEDVVLLRSGVLPQLLALEASETAAAAAPAPARPDEKITAFIGTLRVAGVRALGEDSRVLINDRVYRVNDVIDRTLGVRSITSFTR